MNYEFPVGKASNRSCIEVHLAFSFDTELLKSPVDGWFKILSQQQGEYYNVPIIDDEKEEEMRKITKQLEVITLWFVAIAMMNLVFTCSLYCFCLIFNQVNSFHQSRMA